MGTLGDANRVPKLQIIPGFVDESSTLGQTEGERGRDLERMLL